MIRLFYSLAFILILNVLYIPSPYVITQIVEAQNATTQMADAKRCEDTIRWAREYLEGISNPEPYLGILKAHIEIGCTSFTSQEPIVTPCDPDEALNSDFCEPPRSQPLDCSEPRQCGPAPSSWYRDPHDATKYCNSQTGRCIDVAGQNDPNAPRCIDYTSPHCKLVVDPNDPNNTDKWRLVDDRCVGAGLTGESCRNYLEDQEFPRSSTITGVAPCYGVNCEIIPNPFADELANHIANPFYGIATWFCEQVGFDNPKACGGLTNAGWGLARTFPLPTGTSGSNLNPSRGTNPTRPFEWQPVFQDPTTYGPGPSHIPFQPPPRLGGFEALPPVMPPVIMLQR
jgi:hypothetical protein